MKRLGMIAVLVVVPSLAAQQPPPPADTGEAARLRQQIEQRFTEHVQQELRLSPDQVTKLRATQERFGDRRRTLLRQQLDRRRALEDQMQPGVAAKDDSVRKLMDGLQAGRGDMVRLEQEEDREMAGYLTPVQRARYQRMREHFLQRVNEMRAERRARAGPRAGPRGGARPEGRRPPARGGGRPRRGSI